MSLVQTISNYISSWEGHSEIEGSNYLTVRDLLSKATISQINIEFNSLTKQSLWVTPLLDLFYDELLKRLLSDTTFAISTACRSFEHWIEDPFVLIRIGFETEYPIIDTDGSIIAGNNPEIFNFTLTNDDFETNVKENLIRMFLDNNLKAIVQANGLHCSDLKIIGLEGKKMKINFFDPSGAQVYKIKPKFNEDSDWLMIKNMYVGARDTKPAIVDPYNDKIIKQLVDTDLIENIILNDGFTREGKIDIEVDQPEDDSDEVAYVS